MKNDNHLEHEHGESCGCGHDHAHEHHEHHEHEHGESCGCGHDHAHEHHEHEHGESCGCGHEHHHEHGESCGCGHEHHHEPEKLSAATCEQCGQPKSYCTCGMPETSFPKKVYLLENLGCANCAAKMEDQIKKLPDVEYASITFATNQLRIAAKDPDALLPQIQKICASIESEVKVVARTRKETAKQQASEEHKEKNELLSIITGALFFVAGIIFEKKGIATASLVLFIAAYLTLGAKILLTAGKNLLKGHIFDENFLMSIATLGAFVIREYPEAVGVMLFYRIGEFFEHQAVEKSRKQIMSAIDLRPEVVTRVKNNAQETIPAEDAQIGDILLVKPGDRIPLDGVVLDGESRIDTSAVTGEPVPVAVKPQDSIISGCVNTSGLLKIRVEKTLDESMVSRILDSVENAAASKPKIDRFITRFSRIYTPFVVALALLTAIVPSLITGDWNKWVYTALTFLVISCPCALVLSVPLAFFSGIGVGSKKGILFKGGSALEALKNIQTVVMDKTGTITKGNFVLQKLLPVHESSQQELLLWAASCEQNSTHPIAGSLLNAAKEQGLTLSAPTSIEEIAGHGIKALFSDTEILCGNKKLMDKFDVVMPTKQLANSYGTEILVAKDGKFIGSIVISDTIKPDAFPAIQNLKKNRIYSVMLTGDAQSSADAVAKSLGIDEVHAKLLPEDKFSILQEIRKKHGAVMFVGDGINDAPVLAGADVGAAMGSGADAAIEAADVVFMTSDMNAIPQSISIAKITNRIAWQNVIFALIIKALVMVLGLCGIANMWLAVFADSGVAMLCVLNSIRILYKKK